MHGDKNVSVLLHGVACMTYATLRFVDGQFLYGKMFNPICRKIWEFLMISLSMPCVHINDRFLLVPHLIVAKRKSVESRFFGCVGSQRSELDCWEIIMQVVWPEYTITPFRCDSLFCSAQLVSMSAAFFTFCYYWADNMGHVAVNNFKKKDRTLQLYRKVDK